MLVMRKHLRHAIFARINFKNESELESTKRSFTQTPGPLSVLLSNQPKDGCYACDDDPEDPTKRFTSRAVARHCHRRATPAADDASSSTPSKQLASTAGHQSARACPAGKTWNSSPPPAQASKAPDSRAANAASPDQPTNENKHADTVAKACRRIEIAPSTPNLKSMAAEAVA